VQQQVTITVTPTRKYQLVATLAGIVGGIKPYLTVK